MFKQNINLQRSEMMLYNLKCAINFCLIFCIIFNNILNANAQNKDISQSQAANVLPEPPHCGPDHSGDKIYDGTDIAIDQYPWLVLLDYKDETADSTFRCVGSLINQRYVLTAAHCLLSDISRLTRIRLGEYDTKTEIDCKDNFCNNKVIELGYEEIISHPEYSTRKRTHDIALIRLAENANYTDFIQPICLPLPATKQDINAGDTLTVAGWGTVSRGKISNTKQQAVVPVIDRNNCTEIFSDHRVVIAPTHICAGGELVKDGCQIAGAPLMHKAHKQHWYLEGIASFGYACGTTGFPTVYTRVSEYVDWIQSNIKA